MNPHRTNDPVKRAEHIANRLEKENEQTLVKRGEFPFHPEYWLEQYKQILPELADDPQEQR